MGDIRDRKKKTDRPKGRKEEENKMKLNKVQAMDINQLDMVAGGSINEVVNDFDHLRNLKITGYKYDRLDALLEWGGVTANLEEAWRKVGVHCYTRPCNDNTYTTINGKTITRSEAFAMARNFANAKKN